MLKPCDLTRFRLGYKSHNSGSGVLGRFHALDLAIRLFTRRAAAKTWLLLG